MSSDLLNNYIDKEVREALLPLYIFQAFFLMTKYDFVSNFISPKNNVAYFKSAAGAILLILSHFLRFFYHTRKWTVQNIESHTIHFLAYLDLILYSIICIFAHIIAARQSCNTVELIINLQQALNRIRIDKKLFLLKLKYSNWISVIPIVCAYGYFSFTGAEEFDFLDIISNIVMTCGPLIYDLHIIEVTRTVVLIRSELDAWNETMHKLIKENNENEARIKNAGIFAAYKNIIKAFSLCNRVYQFSVTHFGLQSFVYVLVNLQLMLEFSQLGAEVVYFQTTKARLIITAWNLKNVILMTVLSFTCESFYGGVRDAEATCAQILAGDRCAEMRKACKNVLRLNRAAFQKLSAFGIFQLDAAFPLRLLAGLVPYTVVLLQFAYL